MKKSVCVCVCGGGGGGLETGKLEQLDEEEDWIVLVLRLFSNTLDKKQRFDTGRFLRLLLIFRCNSCGFIFFFVFFWGGGGVGE